VCVPEGKEEFLKGRNARENLSAITGPNCRWVKKKGEAPRKPAGFRYILKTTTYLLNIKG